MVDADVFKNVFAEEEKSKKTTATPTSVWKTILRVESTLNT